VAIGRGGNAGTGRSRVVDGSFGVFVDSPHIAVSTVVIPPSVDGSALPSPSIICDVGCLMCELLY